MVEDLLTRPGFELTFGARFTPVLRLGGDLSILQRELSQKLLRNKSNALEVGKRRHYLRRRISDA